MYDIQFSIKDHEHERRAAKFPPIPNVFPKPTDHFPGSTEFKKLMMKSSNRVRIQKLVKENMRKYIKWVKISLCAVIVREQ